MLPNRRLVVFFLACVLVYGVLVIPRTPLMDGYRAVLRGIANATFYNLGNGGGAILEKLSDDEHEKDTTIRLINKRTGHTGRFDFRMLFTGYRPTCFLVALVIATPVPWRTRMWAMLSGIILVTLFVILRIWLRIVDAMSNDDVLDVYQLGSLSKSILRTLIYSLSLASTAGYLVPALIWGLVIFRRDNLEVLFNAKVASNGSPQRLLSMRAGDDQVGSHKLS